MSSFQGGEDGGFWQLQTVGDGVGGGLAALREGGADQGEERFLISARHFNRRCFADIQADDRASDLGGRVKTAGLYGKKQLWLGIISHRIADGTSVTGTRSSAKALCGLFLDHDGNILDGEFLF